METGAALQKEPLWGRDFIFIILANLFTFLGFQMLLPTLPVYAKHLGGGDTSAGLVVGMFTLSALIIRLFAGQALDVYGRKGILLSGLAIFAVCVLGYMWAPSLLVLLAIRFIHGIGWGLSSTAASTVAADVIPRSRMGEGMGYYGLAGTISMALAPALGLYLLTRFSFSFLFTVSAAMVAIAIVIANLIKYHKVTPHSGQFKLSLIEKAALRPSLVVFFLTMTYGAIVAFLALYALQGGISNIGPFFTVYALALAVSRPLAGRLADQQSFDAVVIPGIILVAIAMVLLSRAHSLSGFLLAAVVYGAGFGAVQPSLLALAIVLSPPQRRGAANATFFSGFDLGIGLSSIMWGAVAEVTGYSLMYLLTVLPVAAALICYLAGRQPVGDNAPGK
jgi:MFS family permease